MTIMLAILGPQDPNTGSKVFSPWAPRTKAIHPAGRAFFDLFELVSETQNSREEDQTQSLKDSVPLDTKTAKGKTSNATDSTASGQPSTPRINLSKLHSYLRKENFYDLLGVDIDATPNAIRKAYRGKALDLHPDKLAECHNGAPETNQHFINLKDAHDALLDPEFRKAYDSATIPDNPIPNENDIRSDEDFYATFGAIIKNSARWSEEQPCPQLGDADTSLDDLEAFYVFWRNYKSRRDFTAKAMKEIDATADRCERRWFEKERKKACKKHLETEHKRIDQLVDQCERLDPRIPQLKEKKLRDKETARQAKKANRHLAKQAEEAKRIAEINNFRRTTTPIVNNKREVPQNFQEMEKTSPEQKETKLSNEEIAQLTKLYAKFPAGTPERWKLIAKYMPNRTPSELAQWAKQLAAGRGTREMIAKQTSTTPSVVEQAALQWSAKEQKSLEEALTLHSAALPSLERWVAVAKHVKTKTPLECSLRYEYLRSHLTAKST